MRPVILQSGYASGVDELAFVLFLFAVALIALYCALRIPRLPEYQRNDEDQTEQR